MFVFTKIIFIPRNLRPRRLRRCPIRTQLFLDLKNRPKTKNITIRQLKKNHQIMYQPMDNQTKIKECK